MSPQAKRMDERTKAMLVKQGVMTSQGVTAKPKPRRCPRCHRWCWVGMADIGPYAGVWVEYQPTTSFGEFLAQLAGLNTYEMWQLGAQLELRGATTMKYASADRTRIHAAHMCNPPPLPCNPKQQYRIPDQLLNNHQSPPF